MATAKKKVESEDDFDPVPTGPDFDTVAPDPESDPESDPEPSDIPTSEESTDDVVGEAVESIDLGPTGPPSPITPSSTPSQSEARIGYENWVNAEAEAFAVLAKARMIDALLAGGTAEIVVTVPALSLAPSSTTSTP